jgi:hypothetical protein
MGVPQRLVGWLLLKVAAAVLVEKVQAMVVVVVMVENGLPVVGVVEQVGAFVQRRSTFVHRRSTFVRRRCLGSFRSKCENSKDHLSIPKRKLTRFRRV